MTAVEFHQKDWRSWGHAINWFEDPHQIHGWYLPSKVIGRLVGHMSVQNIKPGDVFISPMQSGVEARFIVTKVDWQMDPMDMFFADVELDQKDYKRQIKELKNA